MQRRDVSFLHISAIAAFGGVLALGASFGMPMWVNAHGGHATPAFYFFGIWGLAALAGAAASYHTYRLSGPPPDKPRGGGVRPAAPISLDAKRRAHAPEERSTRKAA
jgi:hypothetical protein